MPLEVGRGQNVGLKDFCDVLTLLPPGASVFHKHMSSLLITLGVFISNLLQTMCFSPIFMRQIDSMYVVAM